MLQITEAAQAKIAELISANEEAIAGLRVGATVRSPFKVDYKLAFMASHQATPNDIKVECNGFDVYMDADSQPLLEEASVDYVDGLMGSGFKVETPPHLPEELKGTVAEKVITVIEEQVNPALASHGGFVTLMDVKENRVFVELGGGCQGCGMARVTLKEGIERMIKEAIPEIEEVVDVTDHDHGDSPYYDKKDE
jgi:Fe/S biogenesis protein NfuA